MIFERKNLANDGIVVAKRFGELIIATCRSRKNHIVNLERRPLLTQALTQFSQTGAPPRPGAELSQAALVNVTQNETTLPFATG